MTRNHQIKNVFGPHTSPSNCDCVRPHDRNTVAYIQIFFGGGEEWGLTGFYIINTNHDSL